MANYEGDVAAPYDEDLGPVLFDHYGQDIARRAAEGFPLNVLEIAAGTGIVTRHLRNRLAPEAKLTAIDISDSMMDIARSKFASDEKVTFQNVDATALPFAADTFDTVVCQFGVMFFDRNQAFLEVHRTLKKGRRFLFSVWDSEHYNPFASLSFEVLQHFFPENTPRFLFDPVVCHQIDPLKEILLKTGFDDLTISIKKHVYAIHDISAFARALVYSPLIFEIRDRGGVDPEAITEALAKKFETRLGSNPTPYPMQAILFEARKV